MNEKSRLKIWRNQNRGFPEVSCRGIFELWKKVRLHSLTCPAASGAESSNSKKEDNWIRPPLVPCQIHPLLEKALPYQDIKVLQMNIKAGIFHDPLGQPHQG
jgi:hypothetical protein